MALLAVPPVKFWPLAAAAVSAAMLATAHTFQHFGFEPCALCLRQREVYWVALAVGLGGFVLARGPYRRPAALALGVLFLTGLAVAVFHAGAEWKFWPGPATCGASVSAVSAQAMADLLGGAKMHAPACDEASWRMLGLSMAGWNALVSAGLAALSFRFAYHGEGRR